MEAQKNKPTDPTKIIPLQGNGQAQTIERVLGHIYDYLRIDLEEKKGEIGELKLRIKQLEKEIKNHQHQVDSTKADINYEKSQHEGSKQLINKLLEDIRRYQNDIEWYKRTYETRSLIGTIKEKIIRSRK